MEDVFPIEKLFSDRVFRVPDYQRGYAWEKEQLQDFIDDLDSLPPGKDHYTGTVVLYDELNEPPRIDEEGKQFTVSEIVDGQQRLTTIVLFLDIIRREMAASKDDSLAKLAAAIRKGYVVVHDTNGLPIYKLELNRDCRDYFKNVVLADSPSPEGPVIQAHQRLADAKMFFIDYLRNNREVRGIAYTDWLRELRNQIVHCLKITLYKVEQKAEVGVIFEVLNDRGKPLSELEKVKNYVLFIGSKLNLQENPLPSDVNRAWTNIFERLMAAGLSSNNAEDQLLRSHWLMTYDHQQRNWNGSKSIKARFNLKQQAYQREHSSLLRDLREYVWSLEQASLAYCDIHNPLRDDAFLAWRDDPKVRLEVIRATEKLGRINVIAPFLPLLMAARLRFATDARPFLALVRLCELFALRVYRWHGRRSNAGQSTLFHLARYLFANGIPQSKVLSVEQAMTNLKGLLLYYSPNEDFQNEFESRDWYHWSGLKYFLYEYEEYLASRRGDLVRVPWRTVEKGTPEQTIEHILPQTPNDPYWTSRFDEASREKWTHDIGNLSLTAHNGALGRFPFRADNGASERASSRTKKGFFGAPYPCYANSTLLIEQSLAIFEDWDERAIIDRRKSIVDWALQRWHADETPIVKPDLQDEQDEAVE